MYFPYLRGRQFELIALRELVEKDVLSGKITPIIEPVKLSSTLVKTIETYRANNKQLAIITNPKVGGFNSDVKEKKNQKLKESLSACLRGNNTLLFMNLLGPIQNLKNLLKSIQIIWERFAMIKMQFLFMRHIFL